ncbi:MAG: hypothetical protein ACYS4T_16945 [Planctomycetota bacterium]|jgi:hypothetical protein
MAQLKTQSSKTKIIIRWLLGGLVLAVLLWLFFILAGRALCHIAIGQIAELTNTRIEAESIDFHTDGSVFIGNLVISPYKRQSDDDTILKAEDVYARFSLSSLLLLRPRLKEIDVNDFVFNAQYDLDTGSWNLSALKIMPPKRGPARMPRVRLKAGTLQYSKISNRQIKVALSVPLDARFEFDEETQEGYSFSMTTATMAGGLGKSYLAGFWKPGSVTVAGGISSVDIPELEMAWIIDVLAAELKYDQTNNFSLKLRMKDLRSKRSPALDKFALVGPAFLEKSPPFAALQRFFNLYRPWGWIDIDLDASGNLNQLNESTLAGKVYCKDVAFDYYKFPYTVEHLVGQIDFAENSAALNNLSGKHGDVKLFFNGWSRDFGPDWKYQIRITSDNMALDNDLYNALSTKRKEFWSVFSPTYRLNRQSQTDKEKTLAVELHSAEAIYRNFPYPLKNLTGKVSFDSDGVIFSDVVSQVNECKITLNGEIRAPGTDSSTHDILIKVNNIPLDSTLRAALPDRQRDLYNQFHPAGLADGRVKVAGRGSDPISFTADLSFKEASLNLDEFPLPISNISANAVFTPDLVTVESFTGHCPHGLVSLTGRIWLSQQRQQSRYHLSLNFQDSRLNDDLFNLLPESPKKIVSELKPEGKVNLSVDLNKESLTDPPDYTITVDCLGNSVTFPQFPYRLKDITGTLTIDENSITLKDMTATPGDSVPVKAETSIIKLNGQITLADNAFTGALLQLWATDIFFDDQLGLALPEEIKPLYGRLSPAGRFDLDFKNVRIWPTDDGRKQIDFDGDVILKNCAFKVSDAKTEWDAILKTKGRYKTGDGFSNGQVILFADNLSIQGKSLTNLKADIYYDPNLRNWSTEGLIADCYGGKLTGKFEFTLPFIRAGFKQPTEQFRHPLSLGSRMGSGPGPHSRNTANQSPSYFATSLQNEPPLTGAGEYLLQVGFDNVDLKRFLSDTKLKKTPDNGYTTGKMNGSLSISSRISDSSSRIGIFRLAISDMQAGELPPLAKLLQVLKLTEPRDFAFDQMFVDSYIKHNGLFVRKLDLSGDSLALNGSGSMDLQTRNIDLVLTARGQRLGTADPSILQSLTEGLGRAVVRVEVTGDFYDPQVTTRALPLIKDSLQILGTLP